METRQLFAGWGYACVLQLSLQTKTLLFENLYTVSDIPPTLAGNSSVLCNHQ